MQLPNTRNHWSKSGYARLLLIACSLILLSLACSIGQPSEPSSAAIASQVAATLNAIEAEATMPPSPTDQPATSDTTATEQQVPTTSPSPEPPPDGVSLNCDGTYQRVRVINRAEAGQSVIIDQWTEAGWQQEWEYDGGDPVIRQITERAGVINLAACQQLVAVPLLYTGSGAVIELHVFQWTGDDAVEVYSNNGTHGDWQVIDDRIRFERSLYLYDEPNCCPCNREIVEHQWNGGAFIEVETEIRPTYSGTPPAICQP